MIANDGNLLPNPVTVTQTRPMGPGERFDIVVDFSAFQVGNQLRMVNMLEHSDGRGPKGQLGARRRRCAATATTRRSAT